MTPNNNIELNSDLESVQVSGAIDDARDLDRCRADWAGTANFNEAGYLDTRLVQHMTATWGN